MERLPFNPDRAAGARADGPVEGQLTVSQVAELIKSTLEQHVPSPLRVIGQVSNLSRPNHWYFSLKDDAAVLSCVAWASSARGFGFDPKDGDEVVAAGHLSHYGPQGRTQLYVTKLRPVGAGALELQFRAMCDQLRGLGYFDDDRKKPLPAFSRRIAVVTSASSAAVQDVIATAAQRCKAVALLVIDVRVQGEGAAEQVAGAIRWVDRRHLELGVDAILVTRGGGSAEDLWAFNERPVADAVFECGLPLVAAIGHESDTTVIELVADARAATPTQAVMRLIPAASQLHEQLNHSEHRLVFLVKRFVERRQQRFKTAARFGLFRDPGVLVRQAREVVAGRQRDLRHCIGGCVAREQVRVERLSGRLHLLRPEAMASRRRERVAVLADRLGRVLWRRVDQRQTLADHRRRLGRAAAVHLHWLDQGLGALHRHLHSVDPHCVLTRGYTYTTTLDGRLVRSVRHVRRGQQMLTRVMDGAIESVVAQAGRHPKVRDAERGQAPQMDLFDGTR